MAARRAREGGLRGADVSLSVTLEGDSIEGAKAACCRPRPPPRRALGAERARLASPSKSTAGSSGTGACALGACERGAVGGAGMRQNASDTWMSGTVCSIIVSDCPSHKHFSSCSTSPYPQIRVSN